MIAYAAHAKTDGNREYRRPALNGFRLYQKLIQSYFSISDAGVIAGTGLVVSWQYQSLEGLSAKIVCHKLFILDRPSRLLADSLTRQIQLENSTYNCWLVMVLLALLKLLYQAAASTIGLISGRVSWFQDCFGILKCRSLRQGEPKKR